MSTVIPQPLYPKGYDSDYTLFKVTNTAETSLSANLEAWATTIYVIPTPTGASEIWDDNGFITINGELIYYDDTIKHSTTGKVIAFIDCIRNVGGEKPKFAAAGSIIRGYVVAQHHNQLAKSIANIENYLGSFQNPDTETLDWKIRYLASQNLVGDDVLCPEVVFTFDIKSTDDIIGTTISYNLTITGTYEDYTIFFGDGSSQKDFMTGTHTYAPNQKIDPYVEVKSTYCDAVISNAIRESGTALESEKVVNTDATTPTSTTTIPDFPDFTLGIANQWDNQPQIPPIVFPSFDIGPFGPITIPSQISLIQKNPIPSFITFSNIPNIPSFIGIVAAQKIPDSIVIQPAVIDLLNSDYCVNCTNPISQTQSSNTVKYETLTECNACDTQPGQTTQVGGKDTNIIQKVQVVVHDFIASTPTSFYSRYDAVKILIEDPSGNKVLVMGSGTPIYSDKDRPQFVMNDPVTITFDDTSARQFYDYKIPLESATYGPASNGNGLTRTAGLATIASPAPNPPYSNKLAAFTNIKVSSGKWKAYVVVGSGPPVPVPQPTPVPTAHPCGMKCKWIWKFNKQLGIMSWFNLEFCNGSSTFDPEFPCNCGNMSGIYGSYEGQIDYSDCINIATPIPTPPPNIENKIPPTTVSISKICIRVYYSEQDCMAATPTPSATAPTPTPNASSDGPWPTFPPYPTFPDCFKICPPTSTAATATPTASPTPTPTATPTSTPTPSPSVTAPTPTPTPSISGEVSCTTTCTWIWDAGTSAWYPQDPPIQAGCGCNYPTSPGLYAGYTETNLSSPTSSTCYAKYKCQNQVDFTKKWTLVESNCTTCSSYTPSTYNGYCGTVDEIFFVNTCNT